jgi:hypothetical protein
VLSWDAPTTNADGSRLTDLAGYQVYLGQTTPACPGTPFQTVPSPTTTPGAGQSVSHRVSGLSAGISYVVRVTAVDTSGNESACSNSSSGVAQPDFTVTPTGNTSFGSVTIGGSVDRTFTVQNTATVTLSGIATAGAPFSVMSGAAFSLGPNATHSVTVRFRPAAVGSFASNVNFTAGGDTLSRGVSGSGTTGSTTLTVTKNGTGAGTVTSSPAGIACGSTCTTTVAVGTSVTLSAVAASGSTFAGWSGACGGTGACTLTMSSATTVTATFNTSQVAAPAPILSGLSPSSAVAGGSGLTLTVNGTGFVASSTVRWNGVARTTTFVSATQLRAAITAADLATVGPVVVTVTTPAPGGGISGSLTFTVAAPATAPATPSNPTMSQLSADATGVTFAISWTAVPGAASYRYVAGFGDGSAGQQGTVTSPSLQLRMPYHASGTASTGFVCIRAVSAAGVQSADYACSPVPVPAPPAPATRVPAISSLSPASANAGGTAFTLTVNGTGFVAASTVRWNGIARTTTFVSATQLRAAITAADLATPGLVAVTVTTAASGGGTSEPVGFTVTAAAPSVSSLSPASAGAGGAAFTLSVSGNGFVPSSVVRWNGAARTTTFVSTTQLRAAITAVDLATVGPVVVTVATPAPGGGISGSLTFTVTAPATAPATPSNPTVSQLSADATRVTFAIFWAAVPGAASYRYVAGFGDGSAGQQGAVTSPSLELRMPYHASGTASTGFVCIRAVSAAGVQSADYACGPVPVPARR